MNKYYDDIDLTSFVIETIHKVNNSISARLLKRQGIAYR